MRLENLVWDARDPHRLGRFWTAALGAEQITDEPDLVEARLDLGDGCFLDLCFPRVAEPSTSPPRLHLDLSGGAGQDDVVARLLAFGARRVVGQEPAPRALLEDPEGGTFRVVPGDGSEGRGGPLAALRLDSADPARDVVLWAEITGWTPGSSTADAVVLHHPAGVGPRLELRREPGAKSGKSRLHLDVRREDGDADPTGRLLDLGATPLSAPGDLLWLVFADPSGNELCVLG